MVRNQANHNYCHNPFLLLVQKSTILNIPELVHHNLYLHHKCVHNHNYKLYHIHQPHHIVLYIQKVQLFLRYCHLNIEVFHYKLHLQIQILMEILIEILIQMNYQLYMMCIRYHQHLKNPVLHIFLVSPLAKSKSAQISINSLVSLIIPLHTFPLLSEQSLSKILV